MMGRPKKRKEEHRVKFGISINPELFVLLGKEKINKSKFIEKLVIEYYEKKKYNEKYFEQN
jgi:hypothetical protein